MPNGADKNLQRLIAACAAYKKRYREWPTRTRFDALILRNLAEIVPPEDFARLASLLELRSSQKEQLSVGGRPGVVRYTGQEEWNPELFEEAQRWLGVQARRDLEPW
jgi:hypothetical protein